MLLIAYTLLTLFPLYLPHILYKKANCSTPNIDTTTAIHVAQLGMCDIFDFLYFISTERLNIKPNVETTRKTWEKPQNNQKKLQKTQNDVDNNSVVAFCQQGESDFICEEGHVSRHKNLFLFQRDTKKRSWWNAGFCRNSWTRKVKTVPRLAWPLLDKHHHYNVSHFNHGEWRSALFIHSSTFYRFIRSQLTRSSFLCWLHIINRFIVNFLWAHKSNPAQRWDERPFPET